MFNYFLISRLRASLLCAKRTQLDFLIFKSSFTSLSSSSSSPEANNDKQHPFTVSYLINSCGLSPEAAVELSKRKNFRLENIDTANAVLDLLKSYGFSQTQVSLLVKKRPLVLLTDAEITLLPKFQFLHSIGVPKTDLPKILVSCPRFLAKSLENCVIPCYGILKSILLDNEERVVTTLKRGPWCFINYDLMDDLIRNVKVMRQLEVPQSSISHLVTNYPDVAFKKHSKFVEATKRVKEMGFDPSKMIFVQAVNVFTKVDKGKWESKLELYKRWGWSTDDILSAFKKFPHFMVISEEKITGLMNFLVRDIGWPLEDIAKYPVLSSYSLKKRIIPRCLIVKILKTKSLVSVDFSLSFIHLTEQEFLKKYVTRFTEDIPLLLNVYKGQVDLQDVLQS